MKKTLSILLIMLLLTACGTKDDVLPSQPDSDPAPQASKALPELEETDWGFLKRLAGHLGTAIMPSVYPVAAQIHVGQPAGRSITAGRGTEKERSWYDRDAGGLCISVRTWEDWEPGDEVCLEGRVLSVKTKECRLEKGLLQFYYTLSDQPGLYADRYDDPYVTGLLQQATVWTHRWSRHKV